MNQIFDTFKISSLNIKKTLWFWGERAFSLIIFFIIISLAFGFFIFYNYYFLVQQRPPNTSEGVVKFDTGLYQKVLNEMQERGQGN